MRPRSALLAAAAPALLLALPAGAHHSFAMFDTSRKIELEGELLEVSWRNPHVRFELAVPEGAGEPVVWELETSSPGMLARMDLGADVVAPGAHVRVAGNPAADGGPSLFATNMLLPDGREILLRFRDPPRWSDQTLGDQNAWFVAEGQASAPELGLFRIWSTTFLTDTPPLLFPDNTSPNFTALDYPLTDEARAAVEAFDPVAASAAADCTPKGMPQIMEQPENMEFLDEGDVIVLHISEYDIRREIHMNGTGDPAAAAPSPHGYSTGAWEDGSLVVRTTRINWPRFNFTVPQSDQVETVERFTPSAEGDRLDYEIVITDPATFTEPIRLTKHWVYIEGAEMPAFDCRQDG